jgi:hypothetical protein
MEHNMAVRYTANFQTLISKRVQPTGAGQAHRSSYVMPLISDLRIPPSSPPTSLVLTLTMPTTFIHPLKNISAVGHKLRGLCRLTNAVRSKNHEKLTRSSSQNLRILSAKKNPEQNLKA